MCFTICGRSKRRMTQKEMEKSDMARGEGVILNLDSLKYPYTLNA
jgi:hypothetical protein